VLSQSLKKKNSPKKQKKKKKERERQFYRIFSFELPQIQDKNKKFSFGIDCFVIASERE